MQNLQQFFQNSTIQDSSKTIRLLRGELTIFKRPKSRQWQCRFKLPNGQWHAASTATEDIEAARTQAISIYEIVKIKVSAGLAITTRTFKQVAMEQLQKKMRARKRFEKKVEQEIARRAKEATFLLN